MPDQIEIALPERFDISAVEGLHQQLEDAILQGKSVVLQGEAVTRLDSAAVQVLLAFYAEARTTHLDIAWHEPSSTIIQIFDFLQLSEHVGLNDLVVGAV